MVISAITFDADQTLWDFHGVYQKALQASIDEIVARNYASAEVTTPERLRSIRDEIAAQSKGSSHRLEDVRQRSFEVFLEEVGHPDPTPAAADLTMLYLSVRFDAIRLYPDVAPALRRLGSRFPLGLLSNGNTYPDRCGLPNTFAAVVMGPAHGFEKPDPRAYEEVARQLGVRRDELLHVGDGQDDIEGANAVGAISVLMNRTSEEPAHAALAQHKVENLFELEKLVDRLDPGHG